MALYNISGKDGDTDMTPDLKLLREMAADLNAEQDLYGLLQKSELDRSVKKDLRRLRGPERGDQAEGIISAAIAAGKFKMIWSAGPDDLKPAKCRAVIEKARRWLVKIGAPAVDLEEVDLKLSIIDVLSVDARRVAMKDVLMIAWQHTRSTAD